MMVLAVSSTASAYESRGTDPDDRAVLGSDPDIRATIRRVETGRERRTLAIVVRAYEDFGVWWSMTAPLDTRGGSKIDAFMSLYNADLNGSGCRAYRRGDREDAMEGRFVQSGDRVRCRVPIRVVRPNKRIRWRLVSRSAYDERESETERAPNSGFYS
jgi:hypothetical protein